MKNEIVLSPEELYYLGSVLQAKYIDYAYIAALNDIGQNYALFENETKASLVKSGILMEDFDGNLEVDASVLSLLKPIFFGETETSIDICKLGKKSTVDVYKFHFLGGLITMVTGKNEKLAIKNVNLLAIKELVSELPAANYSGEDSRQIPEFNKEKITRFVAAKSIRVGKSSVVKTYIESDNVFYLEKEKNKMEAISKDLFVSDVYDIVKGE